MTTDFDQWVDDLPVDYTVQYLAHRRRERLRLKDKRKRKRKRRRWILLMLEISFLYCNGKLLAPPPADTELFEFPMADWLYGEK